MLVPVVSLGGQVLGEYLKGPGGSEVWGLSDTQEAFGEGAEF